MASRSEFQNKYTKRLGPSTSVQTKRCLFKEEEEI